MTTALDVSKYFLYLAKHDKDKETVSPLKLIKLSYFAYAWNLYHNNRKLFEEEIQAWQHGPVIPELYNEYKHYGARNINLDSFDFLNVKDCLQEYEKDIITSVWNSYKRYSGETMSSATHLEDTPWFDAYEPGKNKIIPDDSIMEFYREKMEKHLQQG